MAKSKSLSHKRHEVGRTVSGPSRYGSHAEFVVDHSSFDLKIDDNQVLCKDDKGYYVTFKDRLDSGGADPNRWTEMRLSLSSCTDQPATT